MVLVPERRKGRFGASQEGGVRTLLSEREADLLRMAYWCQYLSPDNAHGLSSAEEIAELVRLGFLRIHRSSGGRLLFVLLPLFSFFHCLIRIRAALCRRKA